LHLAPPEFGSIFSLLKCAAESRSSSCPAPLTPTLSGEGRGSRTSLRLRVLLLIQRT
jgi:hypothetical protein